MDEIQPNDRIAVFGQTGSGKSMLSHWLFWQIPQSIRLVTGEVVPFWRLIIDVANSIDDPGSLLFYDPANIPWDQAYSLQFIPDGDNPEGSIDALYRSVFAHGYCMIWLDEANEVSSANKTIGGLRKTLLQGRKLGIGNMAVSPRPKDISRYIIDQAQHLMMFYQSDPSDIRDFAARIGVTPVEMQAAFNDLSPFEYYWYNVRIRLLLRMPPLSDEIVEVMGGAI